MKWRWWHEDSLHQRYPKHRQESFNAVFVKGSVYDAEPLIIKGKVIPNEWVINGAVRPHKHDSGWIAIAGWNVGMFIPGIATFDEVK